MASPGTSAELRLEVREFRDLTRWRWVLTDASGAFLADHEVRLNPGDWQFEAFGDLPFYLRWHVAPDRRAADEERIAGQVGDWIGSQVLGTVGPVLLGARPAVVHVVVPSEARDLLMRPLELAHAGGRPLAVQDVTLVMSAGTDLPGPGPVGDRLRVLGLFSLPEGRRALNLRRERRALVRLIEGIAAAGKAAEARVLQYGVTRAALRAALEEAEGWDIIHVSGHGRPGSLLLETASGDPDPVAGPELADLLSLARGRLKLVTVSACWSAAVAAGEQRRLLGLPDDDAARAGAADAGTVPEALATGLAERLGCAVLAMRYPVHDDFALALARRLYDLLADKGQPLSRAVGLTLRSLSAEGELPSLAVATPALFGGTATDLRLAAPPRPGPLSDDTTALQLAGFPAQPDRFVGRTGVMARASSALAARSGVPGVLLHGMPGGGKTACALELAYAHEHGFDRLVWYKAPDEGMDVSGSLTDFALTMERFLDGFQMAHLVSDASKLSAFLPRLTELMERRRLLIVIDNLESLLTESGAWRDDRWSLVVGALCGHAGLGRLLLTSRRVPVTAVTGLRVEPVDALSADEALLLVRELPHLQALGQGKLPGLGSVTSRRLARRAIEAAQGHPTLLELADGQAAHPDRLAALVEAGDRAWRASGGLPEGFFTSADGTPSATDADYLQILGTWTKAVTDVLALGERDLFWFLCCLEEADRIRSLLETAWNTLWQRLGREGEPPGLDTALSAVAAVGLLSIRPAAPGADESYAIHPVIAAAGRAAAGQPFRDTVDFLAAEYWRAVYQYAGGETGDGVITNTGLVVRAGLSAVPYLVRQRQWAEAATFLEHAFSRAPYRPSAVAVLPAIALIARHEPRQADVLARILHVIDPAAGEARLRSAIAELAADGDYRRASADTAWLIDLCRADGRLGEALTLIEQLTDFGRRAGLGPWSQLSHEVLRLRVLLMMRQASQVLAEVGRLRDHMETLPPAGDAAETAVPWNVREALLDTGREAARILEQWEEALALNAALLASARDRGAPELQIVHGLYNDAFPLLRLGRVDEALAVLWRCHQAYLDAHEVGQLGRVLGALADAEDQRGHRDAAIRMVRDALRYDYLAGNTIGIAAEYHSLGHYLRRDARPTAPVLACHLAAALIHALIGVTGDDPNHVQPALAAVAVTIIEGGDAVTLPADVAELSRQIGDIPGTDLPALIAALSPGPEAAEATLRHLIANARQLSVQHRDGRPPNDTP